MSAQYHATRAQRAFLVQHQVDPGYAGDNVVQAWRFDRCLDLDKFIECLRTVFSMAAPLGDTFHFSEGEWIVRRGPTPVPEVVDLTSRVVSGDKSAEDEESVICRRLVDEVDRGIDVASGPLCTVRFFVGVHAYYLAMVGSHLIVDAYTGYALVSAVSRLYNGTANRILLERLSLGPEAFSEPPVSERALERLTADLGEVRGFGTLTADGLTLGVALSGTTRCTKMPAALHEKFLASSRVKEFGSVPIFLAAHAKTLSILGDRSDVVISVPLANRRGVDQRGACGDFVNTQVMHLAVDTQTTHDLLRTCFIRLRGLQRYQHVGIDAHRASILPDLPSGVQPDNIFTAYKTDLNFRLDGVPTRLLSIPRRSVSHPLATTVVQCEDHVDVTVSATSDVAVADPGQLFMRSVEDLLDENRDHRRHRYKIEPPGYKTSASPVVSRFEELVRCQPDSPAVVDFSGRNFSYRELHDLASIRAEVYRRAGCRAVVVSQPRGIGRIVSLMATQLAGVVHVPLEPVAPIGRLKRIVEILHEEYGTPPLIDGDHSGVRPLVESDELILTGHRGEHSEQFPTEDSYMLFTSGSTGRPKAIPISPAQVARFIDSFTLAHDIDGSDRWVQFHSTSFDFSVLEIFGALLTGGSVVTLDDSHVLDPAQFLRVARERSVTVLTQTPSALRRWRDHHIVDPEAYSWRTLLVGAEKLERQDLLLWQRYFGTRARVFNLYGPTETTVAATSHEVDMTDLGSVSRHGESVIGRAIPGVRVAVVDRDGCPVPPGVAGEIAIAGDGVGRGYLFSERSGSTWFGDNAWLGKTYYSGDRGRMGRDGLVTYLGRKDEQVQIRGHRVELGEIESALLDIPGVTASHVMVHDEERGQSDLVGFVAGKFVEDSQALRRRLSEVLPHYMVPNQIVVCEEFPVSQSGKVDVKALTKLLGAPRETCPTTSAKTLETQISAILADVIGATMVDIDTGFMEAGGTSMHLVTAHERLVKELDWPELELVDIFAAGTARRLAALYPSTTSGRKETV